MRTMECNKGHLYDADIYSECPYCNHFQQISFEETPVSQSGSTVPIVGVSAIQGGATPEYRQSAVENSGPTRPPKNIGDQNPTVSIINRAKDIEPIVGWLICVKGSNMGKDYRLYGKINTVGRSEQMDVCIHDDPGITREVHMRIAYDPKHNNFHIIPANSSNNTYLNDEPVYTPTLLNPYDTIELGTTKLLFLPLCGRYFSWEKGLTLTGGKDGIL